MTTDIDKAARERLDMLHTVKEIAYMLALIGAAVALAATGHETLAATALGGAISPVLNRATPVRVPAMALALGLGAAVSLTGCTAAQAGTGLEIGGVVIHYSCVGAHKLCETHHDVGACQAIEGVCDTLDPSSATSGN